MLNVWIFWTVPTGLITGIRQVDIFATEAAINWDELSCFQRGGNRVRFDINFVKDTGDVSNQIYTHTERMIPNKIRSLISVLFLNILKIILIKTMVNYISSIL